MEQKRARHSKARVEGQSYAAMAQGSENERRPDPAPGNNGQALSRLVAFFKDEHPEEWESLRLCPLQHGVAQMIETLERG